MTFVLNCHLALTRNTTALMAVTARTKLNTRAERIAGSNQRQNNAPERHGKRGPQRYRSLLQRLVDLRQGGDAAPDPHGMFRKMKEITRMVAVPVRRKGDWLNAMI